MYYMEHLAYNVKLELLHVMLHQLLVEVLMLHLMVYVLYVIVQHPNVKLVVM